MSKRIKILHGLVILAILAGAFYWFQWRPSQIRKECVRLAIKLSAESKLAGKSGDYDSTYKMCTTGNGLEK